MIEDMQSWTAAAKGSEISLSGPLSTKGLRRLLAVVDSPIEGDVIAPKSSDSAPPFGETATPAKKSRDYFRSIGGMADDLKDDMKNAKNLASTSLYFEKYAKRIERLPILGVDEELVNYGAYVANGLRQAAGSVRTMGIRGGVRKAQVTGGGDYWGGGYEGAYGDIKDVGVERRVIRAEEKGTAAFNIQQLRHEIITATAEMRRKMTLKYQVEF
jgi:hypothetical protein